MKQPYEKPTTPTTAEAPTPQHVWEIFHKQNDVESLKRAFMHYLEYILMKDFYSASDFDKFKAFSFAIRERLIERWLVTQRTYYRSNAKRVYYLSMEFLIGRVMTTVS